MKKLLLFFGLLLWASSAFCDNGVVVINGEVVSHSTVDVTVRRDSLFFSFDGGEPVYLAPGAVVISLNSPTGINDVSVNAGFIAKTVGDVLHIEGMPDDAKISIYTSDGKLAVSRKAQGTTADVSLAGMSSGTYILKINKQIVKFVKR